MAGSSRVSQMAVIGVLERLSRIFRDLVGSNYRPLAQSRQPGDFGPTKTRLVPEHDDQLGVHLAPRPA